MLLGVEATADLRTVEATVTTPLTTTTTRMLATPDPLVVPILRAGLGLLDGMLRLLPSAEVGFLGLARDETTLQPSIYADRFPVDITGRQALVLDPMLATGGSLNAAISLLFDRGVESVTAMVLIAAPEGIAAVSESFGDRDVTLIIGALDEKLNEDGYIVPGLGDAGDRLYGGV
jgi:uracil phosphoribosyltransferase